MITGKKMMILKKMMELLYWVTNSKVSGFKTKLMSVKPAKEFKNNLNGY